MKQIKKYKLDGVNIEIVDGHGSIEATFLERLRFLMFNKLDIKKTVSYTIIHGWYEK